MASKKPIGTVTRGTTNPNRLRRVDRFIASLPIVRTHGCTVVDLGYGGSPITAVELHERLSKLNASIRVVGVEIDRERVERGLAVAKPGLDGHSNGAEQIAVAARDAGMEVVYSGIRLTPAQIVASARDEDPDVIGLSILSGSHLSLVSDILELMKKEGLDIPVILGGIIPEGDRDNLKRQGIAAVYTPKDFDIARIMNEIAHLVAERR